MIEISEGPEGFKLATCEDGMTLRDYFAAHAPLTLEDALRGQTEITLKQALKRIAHLRYIYADGMLEAREQKTSL